MGWKLRGGQVAFARSNPNRGAVNLAARSKNWLGSRGRIVTLGAIPDAPPMLDRPPSMHQRPADSCLASITPLPKQEAGRVLTLGWKLLLNASLLLVPVLMVGLVSPLFVLSLWVGSGRALLVSAVVIPLIVVAQVSWAGTYPEWPMNQLLVRRLRRSCRSRTRTRGAGGQHSQVPAEQVPVEQGGRLNWIETARLVEWVPRENWNATKLDTAEDVMLIHVDGWGVVMEGDFSRYRFPAASIIDVHVESVRPTGCFHRLHFVVVTVRTEDGPLEFALAYRDHRLGGLRSRHRRRQTEELCGEIRRIATGGDFSYRDPDSDRLMHLDPAHLGVDAPAAQQAAARLNPYAAPRSL
ncbi:hypothetical protein TBK1r_77620 [Stieleria magnilauensis]|uniref:Uncharacterized protein n=2 Tax=Stieleria magnilauensis TaxID=2527963 RepID=A0ABX5Y4K4_9BACT|nr:hypothetical protein TBK1r_77620 [Planctomycetes bacterium TBK1r]